MRAMKINPQLSRSEWGNIKDVALIVDSLGGLLLYDEEMESSRHLCLIPVPETHVHLTIEQYMQLFVAQAIDKVGDLMSTFELKTNKVLPLDLWKKYETLRNYEAVLHGGKHVVRKFDKRGAITYG